MRDPKGFNTYLDPFWIHSENPAFRSGGHTGLDERDTYGTRLWGQWGDLKFDWTLARQTGEFMDRGVDAWDCSPCRAWRCLIRAGNLG